MANPAPDDWGQGVAADGPPGDPWGTGVPVNENQADIFGTDQAQEAVQTYAPGAKITSTARTPQHNMAVGGVSDSMHLDDQAMDIVLPKGMTADQFRARLAAQGYPITEFINEGDHVHWGWGAKKGLPPGQDPWGTGQPIGGAVPDQGVMPGKLVTNDALAPHLPKGAPRPLAPGEYVQNPDGSWSSEITATVQDPSLMGGKPTVIPTLWLINGKPTRVSEDRAVELAAQSGLSFRTYKTIGQADKASMDRESAWQKLSPQTAMMVAPLWKPYLSPEDNANITAIGRARGQTPAGYDATQEGYQEGDLDRASQFWGGVWHNIKAGIQATPAAWEAMKGSAMQLVGEHPGAFVPGEATTGMAMSDTLQTPQAQAAERRANAATAQMGASIRAEANARVKQFAPDASAPESDKLAFEITRGTIDMLPVLAATEITGNPLVGGGMIAGQAFVQKYGEARDNGRSANEAAMDSAFTGITNGALGSLPLGMLMKPGQSFLGKTVQSAASFGAISVLTEGLQVGYDLGLVNPNMTTKEAIQRIKDAGITGVLQGAFLGGGHAALESAVNHLMAANKPPPPRVEPTAAAAPPAPVVPPAGQARAPLGAAKPGEQAIPGAESIQAQVRASLGLDKPGRPPVVDEWGQGVAITPAPMPAPEAAQPASGGIERRVIAPDVAVTSAGREVPVHYAVVEAGHLVPSQTQEGNVNQNYPQELQPRDRTRAVSQAQIATIAQNINPRLLDRSPNASDGAPIVAPSGVVESGNGRTLAIQRAYEQNMQSAYQYRQYLLEQGYPVEGMKAPMLVRVRTDPMTPEDRQAFVREANQAGQLGYSATERAMSDASAMPDHALELYRGGDVESAANRPFVRMFMDKAVSANEHAGMIAADGTLSQEAIRRVRAALLAKAYGDPDLVAAVNESQDNNVKAIGGALTDSAGEWSKMRSAIARGEIPPEMDQTANLLAAVKLVDRARADGRNVAEFVNQQDIFSGQALDPKVEGWLGLLFQNTKDWTKPAGREKVAEAIRYYAQEAQKAELGPNLLGTPPVTPGEILATAKAKQYGQQPPEAGAPFRFGEDLRAYGEPGVGPRLESPEAGGGAGAAQGGAQERDRVSGDFGPAPRSFTTAGTRPGERLDLASEARDFMVKAGVIDGTPLEKIGALSNWIAMRGRQWGFETMAAISDKNDLEAGSDGIRNSVSIPMSMRDRLSKPDANVITIHNHPSGGSFSGGDLAALAYPGHAGMVVVTHDGKWHAVSLAGELKGGVAGTTWRTVVDTVKQVHGMARMMATSHVDALYNARQIGGSDGNTIISQATMRALSEAGIINYNTNEVVPVQHRAVAERIVNDAAAAIRKLLTNHPHFGVRPADQIYRPAPAVQLAGGLQGVLERAGRAAGFTGGPGRPQAGAGGPAVRRTPEQLQLLEDEDRYTVKPPRKLYRGIVTGQQESGKQGLGTFHLGRGLYSSPDRNFAKMYGQVTEVSVHDGWPRKPLVLRGAGGAQSLLHDWIFKNTDYKNIREFNRDYPDPGTFVRSKGYDGVIAGDEVVKYPDSEFEKDRGSSPEGGGTLSEDEKRYPDLLIQHNISPENLLHADRMGGIAAPALAITKAEHPMTSFGNITLIGPKEMADPRRGTRVFGADIYSPRYPEISYRLGPDALKKLNAELAPYWENGGRQIYSGEINLADDLRGNSAFEKYAQKVSGEKYPDYRPIAKELLERVGAEERIFRGFTNQGNRRYIPHTLDNVVRILKTDMRGGENFNYGVGSLRAHYTPEFKSVKAIRESSDRLRSEDDFDKIKKDVDDQFWGIANELQPYSERGKEFGFGGAVIGAMTDAKRMGLKRALDEWRIKDVPQDILEKAAEFLGKLRNLPTEYFEAKILRGVGISEFTAAVVPHDTPQNVRDTLEKRGVKVHEYPRNDEDARRAAIAQAAGEHEALFEDENRYPRDQTETPQFRNWFKSSKVVDGHGKPKLVYHHGTFHEAGDIPRAGMHFGTKDAANERAIGKVHDDALEAVEAYQNEDGKWHWDDGNGETSEDLGHPGYHDKAAAESFGKEEVARQLGDGDLGPEDLGNMTAAYLSIQNPKRVIDAGHDRNRWAEKIADAKTEGHDGLVYRNQYEDVGKDSYVVFEPTQVKSVNNTGAFDPLNPHTLLEDENRYEATRPPFYSQLFRQVGELKLTRAPVKDWLGAIDNLKTKGVKQDEIDWSGVKDWLKEQPGAVTKQQVQDHLAANEVKIQEVAKGAREPLRPEEEAERAALQKRFDDGDKTLRMPDAERLAELRMRRERLEDSANPSRHGSYTLPGGENYRELLLTKPPVDAGPYGKEAALAYNKMHRELHEKYGNGFADPSRPNAAPIELLRQMWDLNRRTELKRPPDQFTHPHWAEPNVLAHVRFDDRTGPNGEKVLHVAEVQSDWHQKGRKSGYLLPPERRAALDSRRAELEKIGSDLRSAGKEVPPHVTQEWVDVMNELQPNNAGKVPNAPFKTSWHELAMKRLLRYAAEHGYGRLSWDTGDTNAARYDLSQQVHSIVYEKNPDGTYRLLAEHLGGRAQLTKLGDKIPEWRLPEYVGKEVADKIALDHGKTIKGTTQRELTGLDLKVGGQGMRGFYDKILPDFVNKYVKKWAGKVERASVDAKTDKLDVIASDGSLIERTGYDSRAHQIARENPGSKVVQATEQFPTHSVEITPAMRESVMQGQPLFEDKARYETEPGALDARGKPVDQTILPGAEPSAVQLAKAREAAGGGKKGTKVQQKPPGELFGAQGVPGDDQLSLFEDENRYEEIPKDDREALEKAARTGNWIGRFQATGATPEERIRASIAGAYEAWKKVGTSVPVRVREIFKGIAGGGSGDGGGRPPITFSDVPSERPGPSFGMQVRNTANKVMDIGNDILMHVAPMSQGSVEARAAAKTFANMIRLARWHGNRMMEYLKKNFDHNQLRRMWEAADEESVLRQKGEPTVGRGLSTLSREERRAVLEQQADAQNVWNAAINEGMVQGEGLPSYVPRMMVELAGGEVARLGSSEETRSIPGIGRNVRTSTPQMKQRKHLTTEETETAASTKFGTIANVVKDIRTLPLATMALRQAVAGRALINRIKEAGKRIGEDMVVEGHEPAGTPFKWFTLDSPAFKTWRPKLIKNEETGKYEQAVDQNGNPQFEKVPLYVRADWEGPLRAVLSTDSGAAYRALMSMKGRAMTAIMYSPLIHNMVEWGRAFPGAPGKVLTGIIYFQGNRAKNDPETMTEAIMHGLVPIGHQAGMQDITSIANAESIAPGRSWTAKILGAIPGLFSRDAQQAVYRTIDAMGDVWHNTLLWDRVGDLQMGLYVHFRDHLVAKGMPQDQAAYVAAHFANRYAGALPLESMSNMARKIANVSMFSRTYTLGNLGAMKDMLTGLPRDVQAQIEQAGGLQQLKGVRGLAVRKAISIFLIDTALFYASNAIFHSAISYIAGRQDLSDIEKGYVDRMLALSGKIQESPLQLLHIFDNIQALSPTSENEPGRENRVLVGYDKDGTAIYGRVVVGKIGEEFVNWLSSPIKTAISKMSTFLKPAYQLITNDAGFGRHLYDPEAKGFTGMIHNLGNIVANYFEEQIPLDSLKSAYNVLSGKGSKIDVYKTVGPLAGVTFSKGAAGGPAVGELYSIRREHDAAVSAAMPGIIAKIKAGDVAGARQDMRKLGMAPGLQNYYVRVTLNPRLRLTTKSNRALIRNAPPEERARINAMRGAQPQ